MKIKIMDFRQSNIFQQHGLPYENGQEITGTTEDVARLTKEFLDVGLNVMTYHIHSHGDIAISVDYNRFQKL